MSPTATRTRPPADPEVSDATVGLDLRRRRHRRKLALKLLVPLLVLVLVVVGIWIVGFSHVLAVKGVQVRGTNVLSVAQVERAAQVPIDVPMAQVDLDQLTARVDALLPVESAAVTRSWPDTIEITVHERTPAFVVEQQGGYLQVDRSGVGYRTLNSRPSGQVLVSVDPGQRALMAEAAGVIVLLPDPIRSQLNRVQVQTRDSVVLHLTKGRTVVWGDDSRGEDKLRVLQALLQQKASRYDVSAPDQPAVSK